ncbi:MAG: hypothetical protein LC676_05775 [Loktanella sp.]|nr:hypothetical protein [Loktanella sp.]
MTLEKRMKKIARLAAIGDKWTATDELEIVDMERRQIALMSDPAFPAEWGEPLAKYWEVPGPDGEQCVSPIAPHDGPSLAVWRWTDFEATATFDKWLFGPDPRNPIPSRLALEWCSTPPPVGEWERAVLAGNFSTLWTRPLVNGGAK